jgi:hypothetical protein
MDKAQISQIFVYIMTALVIGAVLVFGVNAIFKLTRQVEEVKCVQFKQDLAKLLDTHSEYKTRATKDLSVDCDFREICFVTDPEIYSEHSFTLNPSGDVDYDPIIMDAVDYSNGYNNPAKLNVFFKNNAVEDAFYIPDIHAPNGVCFDADTGKIKVKLEGLGGVTEISDPNP